jgi:hypothetical protein
VTISEYGWLDVLQNDAYLKSNSFGGVTGCRRQKKRPL